MLLLSYLRLQTHEALDQLLVRLYIRQRFKNGFHLCVQVNSSNSFHRPPGARSIAKVIRCGCETASPSFSSSFFCTHTTLPFLDGGPSRKIHHIYADDLFSSLSLLPPWTCVYYMYVNTNIICLRDVYINIRKYVYLYTYVRIWI